MPDSTGSTADRTYHTNSINDCSSYRKKLSSSILVLFILCVAFLCAGAAIFEKAERSHEQDVHQSSLKEYLDFEAAFAVVKANNANQTEMQKVIDYINKKIPVPRDPENWSFSGSLFFTYTLMTTIGYGSFTPLTDTGRMLCIPIGFFGILLLGLFLTLLGGHIKNIIEDCMKRSCHQGASDATKAAALTVFVFAFNCICALCHYEMKSTQRLSGETKDMTYLEAYYYNFITFTTIGLGDFAPEWHSTPAIVGWMLLTTVGLVLLAYFIATITDLGQNLLTSQGNEPRGFGETGTDAQDHSIIRCTC